MPEDRQICSLGELAEVPGIPSAPTIRHLMRCHRDFPVETRGRNGVAYQFDIEKVVRWLLDHERSVQEAATARSEEVKQFALKLLGPEAHAMSQSGLSMVERRHLLEEELSALKLSEKRRELVHVDSVTQAIASVIGLDHSRRSSFSARLSDDVDLTPDQRAAIDALQASDHRSFAGDLRFGTDGDGQLGRTALNWSGAGNSTGQSDA